ncbi:hypothetical protein WA026_012655 [Henosepilachna vigintioctopunctata]|uniref:Serine hydrolase domain-containing protein n=1 Tax=Henosepilachna vigintioctopunctata TaxID=420089 RepID=A0AAW1U8V2_9CUCU
MNYAPQSNAVDKIEKLKILALHGYRQNEQTFRQKTGSFRKVVNKWAEFTYLNAPHKVTNFDNGQSQDDQQYSWFFNKEDRTFSGIRLGGPAIGFEESVRLIEENYEKLGPFDGIWGFSQGACFVGLLCDLQQRGLLKTKFNFAILVAGFKSNSIAHSQYFKKSNNVSSLHVFGIGDQVIPVEMSVALSNCFENPVIVRHEGGHFVPASSKEKEAYQNFFRTRYELKNLSS